MRSRSIRLCVDVNYCLLEMLGYPYADGRRPSFKEKKKRDCWERRRCLDSWNSIGGGKCEIAEEWIASYIWTRVLVLSSSGLHVALAINIAVNLSSLNLVQLALPINAPPMQMVINPFRHHDTSVWMGKKMEKKRADFHTKLVIFSLSLSLPVRFALAFHWWGGSAFRAQKTAVGVQSRHRWRQDGFVLLWKKIEKMSTCSAY